MTRLLARFDLSHPAGFHLQAQLDVPSAGITAVFGRSGSGKTTLLRCLAGLARSPAGFMSLDGSVWQDEAKGIFAPTHRRAVGVVFQEPRLFSHLNVRANLNYGLKRTPMEERRVSWEQVIEILDSGHLLERRPHHLSLGEQQRVAIGRALLTSPRLLLMDEPLASLDTQRKHEIIPFIQRLRMALGIPVIYVSHSVQEILQLADTLVLINDGKTVAAGPVHEIFSRLDLPGYLGDAAGAVVDTQVAGHEPEFALTRLEFHGRHLYIPLQTLAVGQRLRAHILSRDISIALAPPSAPTSVLNIIEAHIVEIGPVLENRHSVEVKLDAGCPLLASITRKSLTDLTLIPGQRVYAYIKAVSLNPDFPLAS